MPSVMIYRYSPTQSRLSEHYLDLHLAQTVLPDGHERRDTILAVVEEDDPKFSQFENGY